MIKDIEIKNFRSIDFLEIKNFKKINLISGKNNSGKTTLLEAINMFYSRNKYIPVFSDLIFRTILPNTIPIEDVYESLFNNFDLKKKINIKTKFDHQPPENMFIEVPKNSSNTFSIDTSMLESHRLQRHEIIGLEICITVQKDEIETFKATINPKSFSINIPETTNTDVFCISSIGEILQSTVTKLFTSIDLAEKTPEFIENLKFILPEIKNISILLQKNEPVMYASIGLPSKIPVRYLGEGTNRLLEILLAIANTRNGVVLIDEIENGFHYSVLPNLWKAIAKFATEYNCQLFATTHSYECIQAMHEALKPLNNNDYCFKRLAKQENKLTVVDYNYDDFDIVFENEFEVR